MSDNALGDRIKEVRLQRGLSQRGAAKLAGISPARWAQVEQGFQRLAGVTVPARPSPKTVRKIAEVLGESHDELLTLAGHDPTAVDTDLPNVHAAQPDGVVAAILADRRLLPEAQRQLINHYGLLLRIAVPTDQQVRDEVDAGLIAELNQQPNDHPVNNGQNGHT